MAKLRYEVDPHNKLIIRESRRKAGISRFRHIIEGRFKIGKGNTLLYHIKAPSYAIARELNLPHQLKFKGNWSLTEDHDLKLTLIKWRRQRIGDELTLKGEIIKIDGHSLLFAFTQRIKENVTSTHILKFEGSWQADENNRLAFRMRREKGSYDVFVFDGIWEVNRRHQIIYHYEKRITKRAKTKRCSLLFNGFWNLTKRRVLTYQLDLKDRSAFDFRIGQGIIKNGAIKFEVGIGISRRKNPVKKDIILYGKWKIKRGVGLIFEMKYGDGRLTAIIFEAEARLISNSKIKFALRNRQGQGLGISLTLSKTLLKGSGQSFIRFLCSRKEKAVYVGAGFMW